MNRKSATAISSARRDQLPAGPPLPLGNDQGPRGRMTQKGDRPEVIIGDPPPITQNSGKFKENNFLHHFFDASETTPKATYGTKKNQPTVASKRTQNYKKNTPGSVPKYIKH